LGKQFSTAWIRPVLFADHAPETAPNDAAWLVCCAIAFDGIKALVCHCHVLAQSGEFGLTDGGRSWRRR